MNSPRAARRKFRRLMLSAAIAVGLMDHAQAASSPFARRGIDPGAQAAQDAQKQGLQNAMATQLSQQSLAAFQQAAQARSALDAAQAAARAAAAASQAGNDVPNGLGAGGLQPATGVVFDPGTISPTDPRLGQSNLWIGAQQPTQSVSNGQTDVTIQQTQSKAILNWNTFNVGKNTQLTFDQSAGGANASQWIALNRVNDPTAAPSRILGSIKAQGQVYLLNRNGVLFGGTSQINTHSLLVSSLDLFSSDLATSNGTFLARGLFDSTGGNPTVLTGVDQLNAGKRPGDIDVQAGASIASDADGYTLLAASNVSNAGSISAVDGQVLLAAVFGLRQDEVQLALNSNKLPVSYDLFQPNSGLDLTGLGKVENTGLVSSTRGDASLVGYDVSQDGIVTATTSVSRPGSIAFLAIDQNTGGGGNGELNRYAGGLLNFGPGSITSVVPDDNGETTTSSPGANLQFVPPSVTLAGAEVGFRSGSLLLAPGASLDIMGWGSALNAAPGRDVLTNRILMEAGSDINVAGLPDVQESMDSNLVVIPRVGQNELSDSPLQRDGFLFRSSVTFDRRDTGVRADGLSWVGSPLLNAQGYVDQVPRTIEQMLTNGGTVNITGRDFVMDTGARLDLDGGYIHFLGGMIQTPRLIGADGRLYDLATADPSMTYVGFAGQQVVDHPRWGVQQTFYSPLLGSSLYYESDYLQGGNAGTLNIDLGRNENPSDPIQNLGALVIGGDVSGQAVSGRYQILSGQLARGGTLNIDTSGSLLTNDTDVGALEQRNFQIVQDPAQVPDGLDSNTQLASLADSALPASDPRNLGYWSVISTRQIADGGFAKVAIGNAGVVNSDAGTNLQVADGGSIAINAGRIDLLGALTAHAGTINLQSAGGDVLANLLAIQPGGHDTLELLGRGDIVLGADALLDVSGRWVNDSLALTDQPTGSAWINGGSISLSARQNFVNTDAGKFDASGSILLAPGAVLDASSGGYVNTKGQLAMRNGVPLGRGGNIALQTYVRPSSDTINNQTYVLNLPVRDAQTGLLQFQGAVLRDDSFAGGGTLSLRALGIQIGGDAPADPRFLHLDPGFFDGQGFGGYDLSAETDATITAGTDVQVTQRNMLPVDLQALDSAATGTNVFAGLDSSNSNGYVARGQLDAFHRTPTNFSLRAGDYLGRSTGNPTLLPVTGTLLLDEGASVTVDAGGNVRLGSRGQVTILGDVTAHGGNIVLSGDSSELSGLSPANAHDTRTWFDPGKSVWVGADSRLDVSGVALIDPDAALVPTDSGRVQPRTGVVLGGGHITLTNDTGYIVVEKGAQFDLSGAHDTFDLPTDAGQMASGTDTLQSTPVWSNGGKLTLATSAGLFFDGTIHAAGGAPEARGGELDLLPLATPSNPFLPGVTATGIVFTQDDSRMPAGLTPGATVEPGGSAPSGKLYFAADRLDGSGIDTLVAGNPSPSSNVAAPPLVPIGFSGNVDLSVARALVFDAPVYAMLPEGGSDFGTLGTDNHVRLAAAYIAMDGFHPSTEAATLPTLAAPGATRLDVDADFIDIGGQFALDGVGTATFDSSGDIRFHTPTQFAFEDITNAVARPGDLLTAGNLVFQAAQLYPASGETFGVSAIGAIDAATGAREATSITVLGNGNSTVPLSAGGTLAFDATRIEQDGTVRAPSGSIVLGVSNPNDGTTRALFGDTPLVHTTSVELGAGSLTSVSLEGATLPYGTTADGTQWQYNSDPFGSDQNLIAPPQKKIELGGASIALDPGAKVDVSGSGDLQAIEWVPGTGGSRDLLSPANTSFASGSAQQVPLYADGRGVYAVVPGVQSPVAATDPVFDQGASPIGVGSAVYLSGVPGLPPGIYTLLPAKYATLPGAFRVVQQSGTQDATAAENTIAPDGTAVVSGYYVDALTGSRDARTMLFDVQSRDVWGQYSQYNTTSANSFFTALALKQGMAVPQRALDAGQLILAATRQLSLGATIDTTAQAGGAGAEVDIASRDVQVTDGEQPALDGYVQLDVNALDDLGAGSLLIGGKREQTAQGTRIDVLADSVVVSNDAANPLEAPEVILVARAGTDASAGLHVDAGSVIEANGDLSAASLHPILIGKAPDASGHGGISGDGALLRVSNAGDAPLIRSDVPDFSDSHAQLSIGAGAQLLGGKSLTLDSTGDTNVSADAVLDGKSISADAGNIRFVTGAAGAGSDQQGSDGLVIGDGTLARFADADSITLRSYGTMDFVGNIGFNIQNDLTLSAGTFTSDGGTVSIGAGHLTLSNDLGAAPATGAVAGTGTLSLNGTDVTFGDGDKTLSGFGSVSAVASEAIIAEGKGDFDFGGLGVSLKAPVIEAASGADNTLQTTGTLTLLRGDGTAPTSTSLGGALTLEGGSIDSDALIRAASGRVELHATSGDVNLHDGARIDVAGTEKDFFDVAAYTQGGDVFLASDHGNVSLGAGTSIDFSAPTGGGDAGSLTIEAANGRADLLGTLAGGASKGVGGSFTLDSGAAVDLDALAGTLTASGIDDAVWVRSHDGNLVLSANDTLKARDVTLIADGGAGSPQPDPDNGNVEIDGTVDASGAAGGDIALWGRNGVTLDGQLLARGSAADQRGGNVTLGTSGNSDGTLNPIFGYENVQAADAGTIALGAGAVIDVSGGSAGGLSGGTIDFRAPLLTNGDVNVTIANGATLTGARDVGLEAYAVWSTDDAIGNPAQHFDGIVDPAGWYDANGALVAGTWTDRSGNPLPPPTTPEQTADYLSKYFFTPDAADAAHSQFYGYANDTTQAPGTLMGFVQAPGFAFESRFADIANFHARAGIELRNPDAAINGGAITVLTSWNLASGTSPDALDFRTHGDAPVLTLRAAGDVDFKASLSDGFFQTNNPFGHGGPSATEAQAQSAYQAAFDEFQGIGVDVGFLIDPPTQFTGADPNEVKQWYGQYVQLLTLLFDKPQPELGATPNQVIALADGFLINYAPEFLPTIQHFAGEPTAPAGPTSPADYAGYLNNYESYVLNLFNFWEGTGGDNLPDWTTPSLPVLGPLLAGGTVNTPSLQPQLLNPLPLATATLIGGDSTSYRVVAGADFTSTLPDAFRAASQANVVLDGHQDYQEEGQHDVLQPIVLRTGTGSIDIVAAQDLRFDDALAPASIYTAGQPGQGTSYDVPVTVLRGGGTNPDVVVGAQANAEAAGDISLSAGRDIVDSTALFDPDGSITGVAGNYMAQFWWPWMQVGAVLSSDGTSVVAAPLNFGGFAQGVLSAGGNVDVNAGRDIRELSVSLPVSYTLDSNNNQVLYGGGNLDVHAGRDVLGGDYFVARGNGTLDAGGSIGSAFTLHAQGFDAQGTRRRIDTPVDTVFALQDGSWSINARGDASIGAIVNPDYQVIGDQTLPNLVPTRATIDYGADSSVAVSSLYGDVNLNTLSLPGELFNYGQLAVDNTVEVSKLGIDNVLPASLYATAFEGGLSIERSARMFPSSAGQLSLLADGDIHLYDDTVVEGAVRGDALQMLDAPGLYDGDDRSPTALQKLNLHRDDTQPVDVYSLDGDIVGGFAANGFLDNPLTLDLPKPAHIRAGRDIVNLDLRGQNYLASDITSVIAGRDLYYTPIQGAPVDFIQGPRWSWIQLGGPGTLSVQAGRDLGPLTSANEALAASNGGLVGSSDGGIRTIANRENTGLPAAGASIDVRYGVAPGIDVEGFASHYIDPAGASTNDIYRSWLTDFVLQIENDQRARDGEQPLASLSPDAAWTLFEQLPDGTRLVLADRVFLDVLKRAGIDAGNPASPEFGKYAPGYAAVQTLFPASFGYTANNLEGGANGATTEVATGEMDMRGSTVQTERGGDIRIVGPGGGILVGSISAPPAVVDQQGDVLIGPNQQGILALGTGDIGVFTDASVLLAQSRIFADRGGDLTMWSSNGDINAGKGAKTSSDKPRVTYLCDNDHFCFVDARGAVSGAGIATLQTEPGDPSGSAVLVAPRGTVDAGDAGIRVAGNLVVASQFVANADNIDVKGSSVGVSAGHGVDTGALSAASSAASAVATAADTLSDHKQAPMQDMPSIISVQVIGFGDCAPQDPRCRNQP